MGFVLRRKQLSRVCVADTWAIWYAKQSLVWNFGRKWTEWITGAAQTKCHLDACQGIPHRISVFHSCFLIFSRGSECSGAAAHFNLRNFKPQHLFKDLLLLVSLLELAGLISISSVASYPRIKHVFSVRAFPCLWVSWFPARNLFTYFFCPLSLSRLVGSPSHLFARMATTPSMNQVADAMCMAKSAACLACSWISW